MGAKTDEIMKRIPVHEKEVASVAVRVYPSTREKLRRRAFKEKRPIAAIVRDLLLGK